MDERVGVMLANTGSPAGPHPDQVKAYLEQFLSNRRIVPMNKTAWSIILHLFVLPTRSRTSAAKYATIWSDEGFAFINDHRTLAERLTARYAAQGRDVLVKSAMSFGQPSIAQTMAELKDAGCTRLVVLPLYPQNAFSQASIVADAVAELAPSTGWRGNYEVRGDYSANEAYRSAVVRSVLQAGFGEQPGDRLLLSFHSIPRVDIDNGDTYEQTVGDTCADLVQRLDVPQGRWAVGFQSRFDKEREWLSPFSNEILQRWAAEDAESRLFVVCPNFSVDCLETYYDIDRVMRDDWTRLCAAAGNGAQPAPFVYVPCLGASDAHVDVVMDVLAL